MAWITIIYAMMAGVSATLAGVYMVAWLLARKNASYFAFVVLAASAVGLALTELWMMKAQTAQEFGDALRWYQVPVWTGFCSLAALVYLRLRPRFLWIGGLAVALRTASLVSNFASETNLNYTVMTGISHVLVLGEFVTLATGEPNPWMLVGQASLLLGLLFAIDGGRSALRRADGERSLWLVISVCALVALGALQAVLIFWGVVDWPMMITPLFLLTAVAMANELSSGLLRAERAEREVLAKDAALGLSEQRLGLAAEAAAAGFWSLDGRSAVIRATPKARELLAPSSDGELRLTDIMQRVDARDRQGLEQVIMRAQRSEERYRIEFRVIDPRGKVRWLVGMGRSIAETDDGPRTLMGVVIDISKRRAMEDQIRRQQTRLAAMQLEENTRLTAEVARQTEALREANAKAQASSEAKSKFLSSASHELRAPLHDLLGYAQLLAREIPPEAQPHLSVIQKSGTQLLHLIDDILEFSRGDAKPMVLDRAPVSLIALAAHLEATCAPMAARGGNRFEPHLQLATADWVIADERRLGQVLRNLIDNACKYTRDGLIELRIAVVERTGTRARIDEPLMRFSVRDTGSGIPADQQRAVFEPFKRLDRYERAPGLGLGLAISQQIVGAMGGKIQIQSQPERAPGSLFSFELRMPRVDTAAADADGYSSRAILGYRGHPRTILIVDDRASSRRLLAERCEFLGFEVLEASNGLEALERLCAATTRPDLALVDQFMPELDGWGLLRRVRASERDRDMPMVLISAAPVQRPDDLPDEMMFDEEALKPLSASALTDILQRHLDLVWEQAEAETAHRDAGADGDLEPSIIELPPGCCDLRLAQLNEMLSLGAVVAIEKWAVEMLEQHPDHAALWREIQRRALSVDLAGLRDLTARLQTMPAGPHPGRHPGPPSGPKPLDA
jgi:PAS domain S-box-containing protein